MIEEECMKMLCEGNDFRTELAMYSVQQFAKTNQNLMGSKDIAMRCPLHWFISINGNIKFQLVQIIKIILSKNAFYLKISLSRTQIVFKLLFVLLRLSEVHKKAISVQDSLCSLVQYYQNKNNTTKFVIYIQIFMIPPFANLVVLLQLAVVITVLKIN